MTERNEFIRLIGENALMQLGIECGKYVAEQHPNAGDDEILELEEQLFREVLADIKQRLA